MQPTRWEILQLLKRKGNATVNELSKALGMTLMGVRLHLVVVERDGFVRRSTLRKKPGRPALMYSLTPQAEELFPKRYDDLAETLLAALQKATAGQDPKVILASAAHTLAAPLAGRLDGTALDQRVAEAGKILDEAGAFASTEKVEGGYLIRQHNCLFYSVAVRNRDVCGMDDLILREMLGTEVYRRDCLMDGASCCTHFVPTQEGAPAADPPAGPP